MRIKLTWRAEAQGEDEVDLENFDIAPEEWDEMLEKDRLEILQAWTNENYDAVAYGNVISYSKIED